MNIHKLPVYPPADVFPMMPEDELQELAEDIKANGLHEPLVLAEVADANGELHEMLIDGRNRRAACKLAGVEPEVRRLNGEDPTAYVLSANVHRRHMTKGQLAMAVAVLYPEPEKGGRGKNSLISKEFSGPYLSFARAVLQYSPELAKAVIAGTKPLQSAYEEARRSQGSVRNDRARLAKLRDERPDLAELVTSEAMALDDAIAKAEKDIEDTKARRWAFTRNLIDGVRGLERDPDQAPEYAAEYDPACAEGFQEKITPSRLRRAASFANALADQMEGQEE